MTVYSARWTETDVDRALVSRNDRAEYRATHAMLADLFAERDMADSLALLPAPGVWF